jgi:hypothetical protein
MSRKMVVKENGEEAVGRLLLAYEVQTCLHFKLGISGKLRKRHPSLTDLFLA